MNVFTLFKAGGEIYFKIYFYSPRDEVKMNLKKMGLNRFDEIVVMQTLCVLFNSSDFWKGLTTGLTNSVSKFIIENYKTYVTELKIGNFIFGDLK